MKFKQIFPIAGRHVGLYLYALGEDGYVYFYSSKKDKFFQLGLETGEDPEREKSEYDQGRDEQEKF